MNKRIALLVIAGAFLVFTFALVAFSVYTVNTAVAATTNVAPVDQATTMTTLVTSDQQVLRNVSADSGNSVELAVQHIGSECHGGSADAPTY